MSKSGYKSKTGNKYTINEEFADEVIAKNAKRPGQNNLSEGVRK